MTHIGKTERIRHTNMHTTVRAQKTLASSDCIANFGLTNGLRGSARVLHK